MASKSYYGMTRKDAQGNMFSTLADRDMAIKTQAFDDLSAFRSEQADKAKRQTALSGSFSEMAEASSGMGKEFFTGLSAGLKTRADLAKIEADKITEFDPLKSAADYQDELEKNMNPLNQIFGNVGSGVSDVVGGISKGLGDIGSALGGLFGGMK